MTAKETCPSRDTVAALLFGKLSLDQEAIVNTHLEACATCATLAQQIEQESDPLIEALRQPMSATPPFRVPTPVVVDGDSIRIEGYRILGEVGRGGMGVVYRAQQDRLDRPVAIKLIMAGQFAGPDDRVRFRLEGALLVRLNHPNFVQVYEVGTLEIGPGTIQPYLVLEFVEGSSLKAAMANRSFSFREAAERILILARAMEAAHAQGIVHRDLKPANVLIAADGTLKITDFGLAKELSAGTSLTPTGLTVGTPHYMAPEQAQGDQAIGPAADIYALGSILYEMLTGRTPFAGTTAVEVIVQVLQQTPIPASRLRTGVPRDLETICLKCLEKNPRSRYSGAADLADDLACWLENRPIKARPAQWPERVVKWTRRHPLPATLVAFLVLTLLLGSAASTYFGILAAHRADEAAKALTQEAAARTVSDRRAAELQHVAGQAAADAGEVDRGMFLMLRALELADKDPELRRVIELDLAAWEPYLPRLRWYRDEPFTLMPTFTKDGVVRRARRPPRVRARHGHRPAAGPARRACRKVDLRVQRGRSSSMHQHRGGGRTGLAHLRAVRQAGRRPDRGPACGGFSRRQPRLAVPGRVQPRQAVAVPRDLGTVGEGAARMGRGDRQGTGPAARHECR